MSYAIDRVFLLSFFFVDIWCRALFLLFSGIISCAMRSARRERKESRIDEREKTATKVDKGQILVSS